MEPIEGLAKWLDDCQLKIDANSEESVAALETRYAIRIPDDFRRYLLGVAPRGESMDAEGTTWWPLDRVRSIADEYEHPVEHPEIAAEAAAYLFFADYLIWCWAWAICCSDGPNRGRVAFIGGPDDFVSDSFTEFVERYLRDPMRMANTMPAGAAKREP